MPQKPIPPKPSSFVDTLDTLFNQGSKVLKILQKSDDLVQELGGSKKDTNEHDGED